MEGALFYTGDTGNNMSTLKRHLLVQNREISPPSSEVLYLVIVYLGNNVSILMCVTSDSSPFSVHFDFAVVSEPLV